MGAEPQTWGSKIWRAAEIWRGEGLRTLGFRVLGETVYRRLFLYERPITGPPPYLGTGIPVMIALLTADEIGDYVASRPQEDPVDVASRMAQGHRCFVARHEGSIVSGCWAGTGRILVPYLDGEILLGKQDVYAYGLYTLPKFRNFNISMALTEAYVEHFQASGYTRLIGAVMPENPAGLRAVEKRGACRFGTIGFIRFGQWRRDFCRISAGSCRVGWKPLAK